MTKFKDVFSITFKVLAALFIISLILGIGYGLLSAVNHSSSTSGAAALASAQATLDSLKTADRRTAMPKSTWYNGIAKAVKKHCFIDGMSQDEVRSALGEPASKEPTSWTYKLPDGACLKYDGDNCTERQHNEKKVYFNEGYVYLQDTCITPGAKGWDALVGLSSAELFTAPAKKAKQQESAHSNRALANVCASLRQACEAGDKDSPDCSAWHVQCRSVQ